MKRSLKSIFCITGISLCYLCVGNSYQNALKEFARNLQRVPRKVKAVGALSASGQALSGPKKTAQSLTTMAFNRIAGDKIQTMDELYLLRKIMDPALTAEEQNVLASSLKADLGDRYEGINSIAQQLQKLGQVGRDLLDKYIQEISDQAQILVREWIAMSPEQLKENYDAIQKNNTYSRIMWHELERAYYLKTGQLLSPKPADFKFGYSLEEVAAMADPQIIKHVVNRMFSESRTMVDLALYFDDIRPKATITSVQGLALLLKAANYNPESIKKLSIVRHRITELPDEAFVELKNLKDLDLSVGHIARLAERAFSGLANLEALMLDFNKIRPWRHKVFKGLNRLEILDLRRNQIRKLSTEMFADVAGLVDLDLGDNHIQGSLENVFSRLVKLKRLSLSNNFISELSTNALSGLKNLEVLSLYDNQIHLLDARMFIGFKQLKVLSLDYNRIDKLPQHAFLGLESLSYLNLSNNRLKELPQGLFEELKKLKHLGLGANKIKSLSSDTFFGLENLKDLDLSGNVLNTLPPGVFSTFPSSAGVSLRDNPFPGSVLSLEELRKQYPELFSKK